MTTPLSRPWATADINGIWADEQIEGGSITLDAMAVPYASSRITLPVSVVDIEDKLDPRRSIRAKLNVGDDYDGDGSDEMGDARQFDLGIRRRRVDHRAKTVEIELASDEALLMDYSPLVNDNNGPRAHETSVRGLCNYVLRQAITARTNVALNPGATNTAGYSVAATGGAAVSMDSDVSTSPAGRRIRALVTTAGSNGYIDVTYTCAIGAHERLSVAAYAYTQGGDSIQAYVQWLTAGSAVISTVSTSLITSFPLNSWTRLLVGNDLQVPSNAASMRLIVRRRYSGTIALGQQFLISSVLFEPGRTAGDYFDGNTAAQEMAGYGRIATEWTGTAGASTSRMFPQLMTSPAPDADVSAYWEVTNELTNPAPASTTGYTAGTGTSAVALSTFAGRVALRWTAAGTTTSYVNIASGFKVEPERRYQVIGEFGSSVPQSVGLMIRYYDANGAVIRDSTPATVVTNGATWTRCVATAVPPKTAVKASIFAIAFANTAGQFHYLSRLMWYEGTEAVPYFDGSFAASPTYTYSWVDAANASASTRTPVFERDPELFRWLAGVTAWDFLDPFTASTGLRLFCNERREWFLINPSVYAIPNVVTVTPENATDGVDTIGLGDPEVYCTGVVVVYSWTDANGRSRQRTDSAGVGGLTLRVEIDRPWPGDGVAAWMLARRKGQGRLQEVTALADYFVSPAMQISVTLPGTADQIGQLEAVEWGLTDGLMNLRTRALTDLIPGSIDALTGTIDALVGTIDSL